MFQNCLILLLIRPNKICSSIKIDYFLSKTLGSIKSQAPKIIGDNQFQFSYFIALVCGV